MGFTVQPDIEKLKAEKDVPGLIKALEYEKNAEYYRIAAVAKFVRIDAAKALGELKDVRAVEPLIEVLKNDHPLVRLKAVAALGRIGDLRAVEPLISALRDESLMIMESAAVVLGNYLKKNYLDEESRKRIISVNEVIKKEQKNLEYKKGIMLKYAEEYWAERDPVKDKCYCITCCRRVKEKTGTIASGTCVWCRDCTEKLFQLWDDAGTGTFPVFRD